MYDLTAIESMAYHHSMLADEVRTRTFLRAMLKTVRRGDVVLDLVDSWNQTFHSLDYSPARSLAVNTVLWCMIEELNGIKEVLDE